MGRDRLGVLVGCLLLLGATHAAAAEPRTLRPDGPGPFPTVLFVSGCSGFAPALSPKYYGQTAERLRSQGYLVIFVDYLGTRSLASCAGTIGHEEVGRDIAAAVASAVARSDVQKDRVTVIGWSYGGGGAMAALAALPAGQPAPYRAVLLYPDCRGRVPWKAPADVLILYGGQDDVAPPDRCAGVVSGSAASDRIRVHTYPQALHAFDIDELPARTRYPFGTIGYHAESGRAAWTEIDAFLKGAGR